MRFIDRAVGLIAPSICVGCGLEGYSLCNACTSVKIIPFGSRCYRCSRLTDTSATCPKCKRFGGPHHVWINAVYETTAEELVELYKFTSHRPAATDLAAMMVSKLLPEQLSAACLVVPVPTASGRVRQRGFDHTARLAKIIARQLNLEYSPVLKRTSQTRQVGASRKQRLAQASGDYRVVRPRSIYKKPILLVDDIVTTGATIQSAAKALRQAGAGSIDAMVFAKRL